MKRRQFITLLASAAAWPITARAQQAGGVRRIGVLSGFAENDQVIQTEVAAFRQGLAPLGWTEDRNLQIDLRFGGDDSNRIRAYAAELVSLVPEAIVTDTGDTTRAVQEQTRSIPIVMTAAGDPVVNGLVKNIARPEGNITGVTNLFGSIGSKWLALLKQAAPQIEMVGLVGAAASPFVSSIDEAARALSVRTINMPYRDASDIVRTVDAFTAEQNGALIILPPGAPVERQEIIRLAAQHRLPTIHPNRIFAIEGGLMSYGSVPGERFRQVASFVDRILRGARVSELPVQFPTKFELVINLKTAKALGLTVPPTLVATADEVIE